MKHFGLIGFPLGHSFSKRYFTEKFEREAIDASYSLHELETITKFTTLVKECTLNGLNVTIPYKEKIISFLDELDETALEIGAVNVIKFKRQNDKLVLKGYNSDAIGFEMSIKHYIQPHHKKALILGTGGASKAINYVLNKLGIETIFVSRTIKKNGLLYADLNEDIINNYTIIVNASPVGTYPDTSECPDIPYNYISNLHLLFDVVYNPSETLFLKRAKEKGAIVLNGEEMLVEQAKAAWKIWNED